MTETGEVPTRVALPGRLARLHHPRVSAWAKHAIQRRFLRDLRPGDVAWLWPSVEPWLYEAVAARGIPIIMEGINTRIRHARGLLTPWYQAENVALDPAYSDVEIAREEAMHALATHIFCPSPAVRDAIAEPESSFRGMPLVSSYGAWRPSEAALTELRAAQPARDAPVILFVGSVILRKGAHLLLRAWAEATPPAHLVLCGEMSEPVARLCGDALALPSVEHRGFVRDISAAYAAADAFVLPSLEEGDPQVTHEAAAHGLPLLVSRMGGGWMWESDGDDVLRIDPSDVTGLGAALERIARDATLRQRLGARSRALSARYDWSVVGRQRVDLLQSAFPGLMR